MPLVVARWQANRRVNRERSKILQAVLFRPTYLHGLYISDASIHQSFGVVYLINRRFPPVQILLSVPLANLIGHQFPLVYWMQGSVIPSSRVLKCASSERHILQIKSHLSKYLILLTAPKYICGVALCFCISIKWGYIIL